MQLLKKTGTDFTSAQGMDPKKFFEVMGTHRLRSKRQKYSHHFAGLNEVIELDAKAGGKAFEVV